MLWHRQDIFYKAETAEGFNKVRQQISLMWHGKAAEICSMARQGKVVSVKAGGNI